jgi:hypothetical protein
MIFCSKMNLPFEILHKIFIKLHQSDKLECMLVCHHWKIVMEQGTLYDTVCLYSKNGFDTLMSNLSNSPAKANKVNKLLLFLELRCDINLAPLLSSLPNVQTLYRVNQEVEDILFDHDTLFPFFDYIQFTSEADNNTITRNILQSHSCLNLTTLRIRDFGRDIASILNNTPNLVSLTLGTHITGFNTLDIIHKSLPYLQYLELNRFQMTDTSLEYLDCIPTQNLLECVIRHTQTDHGATLLALLKYIMIKYTKLTKLKFLIIPITQPSDGDLANLNENGWAPLFRKLGCQLKKIYLGGHSFEQQITSLDDSDRRIKHLTIDCKLVTTLSRLAESNQTLYIHTLALQASNTGSFVWLNQFRVFAKLKIDNGISQSGTHAVNFPDIITHAPLTLKTLSISQPIQFIDPNYKGVSYSIEKVSFRGIKFPYGIDIFLSRCIPNPSSLKLDCCQVFGRTFNLANLNLFSFRFIELYHKNVLDNKIMVLTTGDNERRWYEFGNQAGIRYIDRHLRPFYAPSKSWLAQDIDNEPGFTLICHSLKNIAFH